MSENTTRYMKNRINKRMFIRTEALAANSNYAECDAEGKFLSGHVGNAEEVEEKMVRKAIYIGLVAGGRLGMWTETMAKREGAIPIDTREDWAEYLTNLSEAIRADENTPIPMDTTADDIHKYAKAARVAAKIEDATTAKSSKKDPEENSGKTAETANSNENLEGNNATDKNKQSESGEGFEENTSGKDDTESAAGNENQGEQQDGGEVVLIEPPVIKGMIAAEAKQVMTDWAAAKFPNQAWGTDVGVKKMMAACVRLADNHNTQQQEAAAQA